MKKFKFILPAIAFVFAAGLALASSGSGDATEIGEFIQNPNECKAVEANCNNMGNLCTFNGKPVYKFRNSATQCAVELLHQPTP